MAQQLILLSGDDNVAVAIRDLEPGARAETEGVALTVRDRIPLGHKVARRAIAGGERILKFGVPVGVATRDIAEGDHVHLHNVRSDYINNAIEHYE